LAAQQKEIEAKGVEELTNGDTEKEANQAGVGEREKTANGSDEDNEG
jgi:hypothetical protein